MKTLKRMVIALLALLPLATATTFADTEHGYTRIFIFGASFMDPGNHFVLTGETAHPPFEVINFASYGVGGHRPTNGHTWVEVMANEMKLTPWAKPAYRNPAFGNYAVSYARARDIEPDPVEPSLSDQVQAWIDNGYCTGDPEHPMSDTLFIVGSAYHSHNVSEGVEPRNLCIALGQGVYHSEASSAARDKGECVSDVPGSESMAGHSRIHSGTWDRHAVLKRRSRAKCVSASGGHIRQPQFILTASPSSL